MTKLTMTKLSMGHMENNTYVLSKGKEAIVIDPSFDYDCIIAHLKENDFKLLAILTTHGHYDHIFSCAKLKQETGAKIYMHKEELVLLDYYVEHNQVENFEVDCFINDGETLNLLDEEIKIMGTPGHSKGCVCYIVQDMIFVGDTLFKGSMGRVDLPTSQPKVMLQSLKKFHELNRDYKLYSGHGQDSTLSFELSNNPYLAR